MERGDIVKKNERGGERRTTWCSTKNTKQHGRQRELNSRDFKNNKNENNKKAKTNGARRDSNPQVEISALFAGRPKYS